MDAGQSPQRSAGGFTLIELLMALVIGSVLTTIAFAGFSSATNGVSVKEARRSFAALQVRARSHALERGDIARLRVDPAGDSVWIVGPGGNVDRLDFRTERGVDIRSSTSGIITLCMNARGFGEPRCNSFGSGTATLTFVMGGESAEVTMLPLGLLEW